MGDSAKLRPKPPSLLTKIGRSVAAHPRVVLVLWLILISGLAVAGTGVQDRMNTGALYLDGQESNAAYELKKSVFGDDEVQAVMLRGPAAELDRQGPGVSRALDAIPRTQVISPWAGGEGVGALRPRPDVAAIVVNVGRTEGQGLPDVVPPVEDALAKSVSEPVTADVTGQAQIGVGGREASFDAAKSAELITVPVIALVLLLVFGSPIAAMIPGLIGGTTVAAGYGTISLLLPIVDIDALGTSLIAMMGLALGVDYSLLMVSRVREEVSAGADYRQAVERAVATSGRAVVFAGIALTLAMLVATQIAPGRFVVTAAITVIIASAFSVLAALTAVPAMLVMLGRNLERWSFRRPDRGTLARVSERLTKRPGIAAFVVIAALLAASAVAFRLDTGPVSAGLLPPDSEARKSYDAVQAGLGAGWGAAFEVIVDGRDRPVTDPRLLGALARFQQRVEDDPGVLAVSGPGAIERGTRPLRELAEGLAAAGGPRDGPPGLTASSPRLAESGYLYLAGVDGAPPDARERARLVLNIDRGGHAARLVIVPTHGPQDPRVIDTQRRLQALAADLREETGARVLVGGQAAVVNDYNEVARERLPLLILVLALITVPVLMLVLRSLLLPLVAAFLNVITVGAAFGALALLFNDSFFGGPGFIDATGAANIITVIFGLSIDYEVFVLARMREEYARSGDTNEAIAAGIARTARVVTGAGIIMVAVFVAFSTVDFISVRNFGVGLAVAVLLDAFVIRLVALPAAMRLLGRWNWWLPGWLDRLLPRFDLEGGSSERPDTMPPDPEPELARV